MRLRYVIISMVLVFLSSAVMSAQDRDDLRQDTLSVYFDISDSRVDPSFMGNAGVLDTLKGIMARYANTPGFRMSIRGGSSLDGLRSYNEWLAKRRTGSFAQYIGVFSDSASIGVDWDGLEQAVMEYGPFPGSDEVLDIIRNSDRPGWRKKYLMDLRGGSVYRWMFDNIFPLQRRVQVTYEYALPVPVVPVRADIDYGLDAYVAAPVYEKGLMQRPVSPVDRDPFYRLALKTNLLADIALMPSLEVEYLINEQWSVAAHGAVAWWSNDPAHKYYQISTIYPEARWWFKTKEPWHGHYLGVFAGGTWYDLERGARGYQGEGGFVGLSYGYMFPISKCLSFEAGLGVGYLYTKYREYLPVDFMGGTHYVYQQTSVLNWLGPLKVKFAFVWRLWDTNKRKGGDR